MRYQHEGDAGVCRACAEKSLKGFKPACRSTDSDNGEVGDNRFRRIIRDYQGGGCSTGFAEDVPGAVPVRCLVAMEIGVSKSDLYACDATPDVSPSEHIRIAEVDTALPVERASPGGGKARALLYPSAAWLTSTPRSTTSSGKSGVSRLRPHSLPLRTSTTPGSTRKPRQTPRRSGPAWRRIWTGPSPGRRFLTGSRHTRSGSWAESSTPASTAWTGMSGDPDGTRLPSSGKGSPATAAR